MTDTALESRTETSTDTDTHPELSQKRRAFEARIGDLRSAFDRDFGWAPHTSRWVLPTMAAAAGFGAALWLRSIAAGDRGPRREVKA